MQKTLTAQQETARSNRIGFAVIAGFVLFCIGSVPFGYDPAHVMLTVLFWAGVVIPIGGTLLCLALCLLLASFSGR
jgi:uncharacterized membrane protein YgdD (TMEM256/DUF423 family)